MKVLDEHLMYILAAGGGVLLIGDNFVNPFIQMSVHPLTQTHLYIHPHNIYQFNDPLLPRAARSKSLPLPLLHAGQVL